MPCYDTGALLEMHLEKVVAPTGRPLVAYSEQVVEAQQLYYEYHYSRFPVNQLNHELYKAFHIAR